MMKARQLTAEYVCVKPQVILHKRGNKIIAVVIASVTTQLKRHTLLLTGRLEKVRV
jgi:hypothetical protein